MTYREGIVALERSLKDVLHEELLADPPEGELVAAGNTEARREQKRRAEEQFRRGRSPYTVANQPRDYRGRFREILARLRDDLSGTELDQVVQKVEDAEEAQDKRDYAKSADAATDVIQMVDKIEEGALNPNQLKTLKDSTRELGRVIAFLPLPQGIQNAKLRFSDVPPSTQQLIQKMRQRVIDKLDADAAEEILSAINRFMSGTVQMSSDDIQREMARMLAVLVR
jgi:GTP1/Obg family GTP-binding protein